MGQWGDVYYINSVEFVPHYHTKCWEPINKYSKIDYIAQINSTIDWSEFIGLTKDELHKKLNYIK